jgi:type IV secretory pathway TrbD component
MGRTAGALTRLIQREPVAFQGCVQATLAALAGFGLVHWSSEQVGLVLGLVAALLAFFTRAKVSPTATPTTPPMPASPPATTTTGRPE